MIEDIYFDNSATTRMFDHVIDEMNFLNKKVYGNPSSLHRKGIEAEKYLEEARKNISASLRCDEK